MAKEKMERINVRLSESLLAYLSDDAAEEHRELSSHCRYLILKFLEKYVSGNEADLSFPLLTYKESSKTPNSILIRMNPVTAQKLEALTSQLKQTRSNVIRGILKHQVGYVDMADHPRLF